MKKIFTLIVLLSLFSVSCARQEEATTAPSTEPIPDSKEKFFGWVDTHTHPSSNVVEAGSIEAVEDCFTEECIQAAIELMDEYGVQVSLLMSPPTPAGATKEGFEEDIAEVAQNFPEYFAYMGGGNALNSYIQQIERKGTTVTNEIEDEFREMAEGILSNGAIGFGEMAVLHLSAGESHAFEEVEADHPLFLLLADIAAENNVPIDIHMDPVLEDKETPEEFLEASSRNPDTLQGNIKDFEKLLDYNLDTRIVWAHASSDTTGDLDTELLTRLLEDHPNLYLQLRIQPNRKGSSSKSVTSGAESQSPDNPLDMDGKLEDEWLSLFETYPDRFILGTDTFYGNPETAGRNLTTTPKFLDQLPEDLARMMGCENPKVVYNLDVGC